VRSPDRKDEASMAKGVRIIAEETLANRRFPLTVTQAEVEEVDGARRMLTHEIYHHGNAAAVLLYDETRGVVLLVRQFRLAAYLAEGALDMLEVCAGMLDGDAPLACALREAWEETGVRLTSARHAFDAFTSPGALTETLSCFVAPYRVADRIGTGGGVDFDERTEIVEVPFAEAEAMIATGAIRDAKTIALIYYARANGLFG
jgi:nudix-type nucleoside diphosphatase (YffH/AdpP family)